MEETHHPHPVDVHLTLRIFDTHPEILKKYREVFRNDNGCDPSKDLFPGSDLSYLELAKEELFVTPVEFGEVLWL